MEIRNLQTFIRVAELKSFTKAAEEMNYVQSTVTMQIKQLELELGYPLFDRIGKKISLTSLGREFLTYAYEIVHITEKAGSIGNKTLEISGVLRIGVLESLLFHAVMDILPRFKALFKNVDVQIKMGQASDLLHELKQNQVDMVYLSADLNTDPELRCFYKRTEQLIFVSGPMHSAANEPSITISKLLEYDFLITERSGICYSKLQKLAAEHKAMLSASVEIDSIIAIASLLQKGVGIAFLPEYSVASQIKKGVLTQIDVDMKPQLYYSQILCHKNRYISPFMESFIHLVQENFPCDSL